MIFEEVKVPMTLTEKKNRAQWIDIGVDFMNARRDTPNLSAKQFSEDRGINYNTFRRAMGQYRNEIKKAYSARNPNKTKSQWVELGVNWLEAKERGMTAKQFVDENELNYETATRAFRKYKRDIHLAKMAKDSLQKKKKLTARERYAVLLQDFRSGVKERSKDSVKKSEQKSAQWFQDTVKKNIRGHKVTRPKAGSIYTFQYDAKHKATLPHWDMFPLIVYLGLSTQHKGLMLGLNLHYIPPKARQEFLEELLKYASTDRLTNKTTLKVNWGKVKSMRGANHMIKAYLPNHVKGQMIEIKPADWVNVVYMPTQKFVTGPKNSPVGARSVWSGY